MGCPIIVFDQLCIPLGKESFTAETSTTQGVVNTDSVEQGRNPANDDAVKAALEKGLSLELACSCTATPLVLLCLCPTNQKHRCCHGWSIWLTWQPAELCHWIKDRQLKTGDDALPMSWGNSGMHATWIWILHHCSTLPVSHMSETKSCRWRSAPWRWHDQASNGKS